jgi:hypothetical protein
MVSLWNSKRKMGGPPVSSTDYLSLLLIPLRIRWTIALTTVPLKLQSLSVIEIFFFRFPIVRSFPIVRPSNGSLTIVWLFTNKNIGSYPFASGRNGTNGSAHLANKYSQPVLSLFWRRQVAKSVPNGGLTRKFNTFLVLLIPCWGPVCAAVQWWQSCNYLLWYVTNTYFFKNYLKRLCYIWKK